MIKDHIDEINKMRSEHMTLQEIGKIFGCSRERIRQLSGNRGHGYGINRKIRDAIKYADDNPAKSFSEISTEYEICGGTLSRRLPRRHILPISGYAREGVLIEEFISNKLSLLGIRNKLMPFRNPYDILLLESGKKLDVKYTHSKYKRRYSKPAIRWSVNNTYGRCDYFICVSYDKKSIFVIPSNIIPCSKHFDIIFCYPDIASSGRKSKYIQYKDRFDLLK